jgi:ribA/ribD-fused uncharacterized protein
MSTPPKTTYIFFWKIEEENGELSQWYRSYFIENDITFNCAEQYMMYYKALLFGDMENAVLILAEFDPAHIKSLGRQVKNFNNKLWDLHKENIVYKANYLKFTQNKNLLKKLLSYKNPIFVEASPYDNTWGIGYDRKSAIKNRNKWGSNLLGKILNKLYNNLKK